MMIMEVQQNEHDAKACGFGAGGKPDFWIGGEGGLNKPMHIAITAKDRAAVDAFTRRRSRPGRRTTARRDCGAHYHANYYGAFVLDPDGHNIEAVCHAPG